LNQIVPVENVVAQYQGATILAYKIPSYQKSLRDAFRLGLYRVANGKAIARAVTQQFFELGYVRGGRDHQDIPDTRQHQGGKRVIDHRFVVNGQQTLTDSMCDGVKSRSRASCQNDSFVVALHRGVGSHAYYFLRPNSASRSTADNFRW